MITVPKDLFNREKPVVAAPRGSNTYDVCAACNKALKRVGRQGAAADLTRRCQASVSYEEALNICREYVTFT